MKYNSIFAATIISVIFSSCQKKDHEGFDSSQLHVIVSKPTEAQVFSKGDTVQITGSIDYISQLHGYSISITDKKTNEVFYDLDEHLHDASFSINTYWVDTLSENAELVLKIVAEADHEGHESSKEVNFTSKP